MAVAPRCAPDGPYGPKLLGRRSAARLVTDYRLSAERQPVLSALRSLGRCRDPTALKERDRLRRQERSPRARCSGRRSSPSSSYSRRAIGIAESLSLAASSPSITMSLSWSLIG